MAYVMQGMEFSETPTFTRLLADLLTDDEYAGLQNVLVENPERGDIIKVAVESESCATRCLGAARAAGFG